MHVARCVIVRACYVHRRRRLHTVASAAACCRRQACFPSHKKLHAASSLARSTSSIMDAKEEGAPLTKLTSAEGLSICGRDGLPLHYNALNGGARAESDAADNEDEAREEDDARGESLRDQQQQEEGREEKGQQQAVPLSKNAQKKLLRMERYQARKLERKAFEKNKRHEETERKRREWESKIASLSSEEQAKALQEKLEKRLARKEQGSCRKEKLRHAMDNGQNLVLDLEFCDRMKPNELVSLVQQVMYSYAANAKAPVPVRMSLTGCAGEVLTHFERTSGFSNWLIHKEERSYLDVFQERKGDLIYLTADSDHVIHQLEDSKVYIIGGLVDRNRWKGLTLEKAKSQGIATGKLPITEHLKMTSSQVLTVNQVVEIMLSFLEKKDWEAALQVIPLRKRSAEDVHDEEETNKKLLHEVGTGM